MNRRTEPTLLVLILLLAAALRLGWPGVSEFKLDEARLSLLALETARGERLPLYGITSSVGIPNPPASVYLFAIPYFFSSDPTLATLFVGLLNVSAVALAWGLARRYFGAWAGLAAALLYAASPWGVIYSRTIWAQDALPPFVLLTVIAGVRGFVDHEGAAARAPATRPWKYQVAHLALLAVTVQIHLGAVSLIPLTLAMLAVGRRRIDRRFGLGVGLAALTLVPFALAALGNGWLWRVGEALRAGGSRALTVSGDALHQAHLTIAGTEIHSLAGPRTFEAYLASVPDVWPLLAWVGWAALIAAAGLVVSGARRPDQRAHLILGLWALLPILTFTVTWTPSYPHYMIPLIPAACIALAAGARALADRLARWVSARAVQIGLAGLAIVVAAAQVYVTLALLAFLNMHDTPGGFGTPLRLLTEARDKARALAGEDEILVVSDSDDPAAGQDPAVWSFLLHDHAPGVRLVDGARTLVFPATPTLLLIAPSLPPDAAAVEYPPPLAETPLRAPSEGAVRFARLSAPPAALGGEPVEARLSNGAALLRWEAEPDAGRFWLTWQASRPNDRRYTLFVHLLDQKGNRVAQADVPAWPGPWRAGDVIVTRFDLDAAPPAGTTWRVGMYVLLGDGATQGVDVLDAAGNPAGQWVDLPPAR